MKKVVMGLWILVVFLLLTGCATFSRNQISRVTSLPVPEEGSAGVNTNFEFSSGYGFDMQLRKDHPEWARKKWENEFISVLKDSGFFTILESGQKGDLNISVDVRVDGLNPMMVLFKGFLGGMTFFTIPTWSTINYKAQVKIENEETGNHEYYLEDGVRHVLWLPTIFVAPFKTLGTVLENVKKNMYKDLILRMQKDGILTAGH